MQQGKEPVYIYGHLCPAIYIIYSYYIETTERGEIRQFFKYLFAFSFLWALLMAKTRGFTAHSIKIQGFIKSTEFCVITINCGLKNILS